MTLLDATSTILDAVKTWCPDNDRKLKSAVKRMEKRLEVLRLRSLKSLRRRRHKGFNDLLHFCPKCPYCAEEFVFGDFAKSAQLNTRGDVLRFDCPSCLEKILTLEAFPGHPKCTRYVVCGENLVMPV